ncbi:MAG: hypothetical protein K6F59_04120 [Gammaproteobacteria bacterium]|nr:hypothetical protein [Gammaproteobacteria bacterium]
MKTKKFIKIFFIVILTIILLAVLMGVTTIMSHSKRRWKPDYEKVSIEEILNKSEFSDEDYQILFEQTGLTKIGVDRVVSKQGKKRLLDFQESYYMDRPVEHLWISPVTCYDQFEKIVPFSPLENGDILVSDSTHLSFWHCGHAELVVNGNFNQTLYSMGYGYPSEVGNCLDFFQRTNFLILRPKVDKEIIDKVVDYAITDLQGIKYQATIGYFNKKFPDTLKSTNCSHLVWYAYKKFGIDIDTNGGPGAYPYDLIDLEHFEIVQVFGFHPEKLWS